jgi:hypothetical protein
VHYTLPLVHFQQINIPGDKRGNELKPGKEVVCQDWKNKLNLNIFIILNFILIFYCPILTNNKTCVRKTGYGM